jgi:peptide/nickel transport system permease protein
MSSPIIPSTYEEHVLEETPDEGQEIIAGRSLRQIAWSRLRRDKWGMFSLVSVIGIVLVVTIGPPLLDALSSDPLRLNIPLLDPATGSLPRGFLHSGISWQHPLGLEPGTGRDIATMLLYGARISLFVATTATFITVFIGVILGTISGYAGGWVDGALGRTMDFILVFPLLIMLLALQPPLVQRLESMGVPSGNPARITYMILVFAIFGWPYLARIIRGQVISMREREFVESAVAMGSSGRRIVFKELIPNLWAPILVYTTITLPTYIAFEAALAFLGVGVAPPATTWGKMLAESVTYVTSVPTYLFIPGGALFFVVLVFNQLGDSVRDALDPRAGRV